MKQLSLPRWALTWFGGNSLFVVQFYASRLCCVVWFHWERFLNQIYRCDLQQKPANGAAIQSEFQANTCNRPQTRQQKPVTVNKVAGIHDEDYLSLSVVRVASGTGRPVNEWSKAKRKPAHWPKLLLKIKGKVINSALLYVVAQSDIYLIYQFLNNWYWMRKAQFRLEAYTFLCCKRVTWFASVIVAFLPWRRKTNRKVPFLLPLPPHSLKFKLNPRSRQCKLGTLFYSYCCSF